MSRYTLKLRRIPLLPASKCPDWKEIVQEIIRAGVPKKRIADNCNISRETIYSILDGNTEPKWSQGQQLLKLKEYIEVSA